MGPLPHTSDHQLPLLLSVPNNIWQGHYIKKWKNGYFLKFTYPSFLNDVGYHHNNLTVLFPDHLPEVVHCVCKGTCRWHPYSESTSLVARGDQGFRESNPFELLHWRHEFLECSWHEWEEGVWLDLSNLPQLTEPWFQSGFSQSIENRKLIFLVKSPILFPEPANFLRRMLDETKDSGKDQFLGDPDSDWLSEMQYNTIQ